VEFDEEEMDSDEEYDDEEGEIEMNSDEYDLMME
jgi:hypothetical protein